MDNLTPKEKELLHFLIEGYADKEIASKLDISLSTTKNHIKSMLRKLNARSRTEIAVKSIRMGIIK